MNEDAIVAYIDANIKPLVDGMKKANRELDSFKLANDQTVQGLEKTWGNARIGPSAQINKQADALRASLDPLIAAEQRHAVSLRNANDLLKLGAISQDTYAAAVRRANSALNEAQHASAGGAGLNRMQMMELEHSARAVFDGLAAGASPVRLLAMESGRLGQALGGGEGGVLGSLKALGAGAAGLMEKVFLGPIGPILTLVAALAGLGAAEQKYEAEQAGLANTLRGFGSESGATVQDLDNIADAYATAGRGTREFAVSAETAFLKAGVTKDNLSGAIDVVRDFAAISGQKAPEALKTLADAFADPAQGLETLRQNGVHFTAQQEEQIKVTEESKGKAAALAVELGILASATAGAADKMENSFGRALRAIGDGINRTIGQIGQLAYDLTHKLTAAQEISQLQQRKSQLQNAWEPNVFGFKLGSGADDAERRQIDARIATLQATPEYKASVANDKKQAAGAAARTEGNDVSADSKSLYNVPSEVTDIKAQQQRVRQAIADYKKNGDVRVLGGQTLEELNKAIAEGDKRIHDLETKGDKKPKKAKKGLADTTESEDNSSTSALDSAQKDLANAQKAAATAANKLAEGFTTAGREAVADQAAENTRKATYAQADADYQAKKQSIEDAEKKVNEAKNDAHKQEELKTLDHALAIEAETASVKKQTADLDAQAAREKAAREAQIAAIEEEAERRMTALNQTLGLDQINSVYARTPEEKLASQHKVLGDQQAIANEQIDDDYNKKVAALPSVTATDAVSVADYLREVTKLGAERATAQANSDAKFSAQSKAMDYTAMKEDNPLYSYANPSTSLNQDLQSVEVKGLEGLNTGLTDAILHTKSLGAAFHDVAQGIIRDLLQIGIQREITQPLANMLFGNSGSTIAASAQPSAGLLGGLFHGVIPGFATGTGFSPSGLAIVGEHGRELVNLNAGSQILNNAQTNNLLNGASNVNAVAAAPQVTNNLTTVVNADQSVLTSHIQGWITAAHQSAVATATQASARQSALSQRNSLLR